MTKNKNDPMGIFTDREIRLIGNCRRYALDDPQGLPGHNILVIVSKLVDILDMLLPVTNEDTLGAIEKVITRRYGGESGADPSQSLFEQIRNTSKARNFVRRDMVRPRRTAEQIAKSQGRDVVYICPDGTFRNHLSEIIGKQGESLHGGPYSDCIPFSFGSEDDFIDWLNEATGQDAKP